MTCRRAFFIQRISRSIIILTLAARTLWLAPLAPAAQAAPAPAPAPAAAAARAASVRAMPAQDPPLPEPFPTLLVNTSTVADNPNDGQCDLWEAMQAVFLANNSDSGVYHECTALAGQPNVIGFSQSAQNATIIVPNAVHGGELPFATGDETILGPITLKPDPALLDSHLLRLNPDAILTLISVTFAGGHTSGGGAAILDNNFATVNCYGCTFTTNVADENGGAISSNGNLNIVLSSFTNNQASGVAADSGDGGAIAFYGVGNLTISKSKFTGNSAKAGGGAIYTFTPNAVVEDTQFIDNQGGQDVGIDKGGGALFVDNNGGTTILRTQFDGNEAPLGKGGAIFNNVGAYLTISGTEFSANQAGDLSHARAGGAIFDSGLITVTGSSFSKNTSPSGEGGGLVVDLGGIGMVGNSTFVLNTAPNRFGAGLVVSETQPGGVVSSLTLENDTIAQNGLAGFGDAGVYASPGQSLTLGNTLLVNNLNGNCYGPDGDYTNALGHNLEDHNSCHLTNGNGNLLNDVQSNLGPPTFNGGPLPTLLTMPPLLPSHAIDAGDGAICADALVASEDERGSPRPINGTTPGNQNPACDIGAFEADAPSPSFGSTPSEPGPLDAGHTQVGVPTATGLQITNSGSYQLQISNISLGGPNAADFSVSPNTAFSINPGDVGVGLVIHCTPGAASLRTASLTFNTNDSPDHSTVTYQLVCTGNAAPVAGANPSQGPSGRVSFPGTEFGATSSQVLAFGNNGNAALTVSIGAIVGANAADFHVVGSNLTINPGAGPQSITVQCTPSDYGLRSATLPLTTNDSTQPTLNYHLSCTGTPAPSPLLLGGTSIHDGDVSVVGAGLSGAYGLAVSGSGRFVYSTSYNDGKVSAFLRNPVTGVLSFTAWDYNSNIAEARQIALSPDGNNAYVAGRQNHLVEELTLVNSTTGEMGFTTAYPRSDLFNAYGVTVSPDGKSVYATGTDSNAVVLFSRASNGSLTYRQSVVNSATLGGAHGVAVSPDGQNVYVTGLTLGTLEVLKRNPADGTLTHVQTRQEGDTIDGSSLTGMTTAFQVTVSPDGTSVYVAGDGDGAVAEFARNPLDGSLTWIGSFTCGCGSVNGLAGVTQLAVTPDGLRVVADGFIGQAAVVLDRDPITGVLTFHEEIVRDVGGNPPLNGGYGIAVSPDGATVYVASYLDNAIAVLPIGNPVPLLTHFSPASAVQNGPAFTLHVYGANFLLTTRVYFGAGNPAVTYISPYQLDVAISSALIGTAGLANIQLHTPQPVGIDAFSFPKNFVVSPAAVPQNPVPSIDHLSPQGQPSGGGGLTLDVYGTNFIAASVVHWNGAARSTVFVNSGHLQTTLAQAEVSQPGVSSVTVFNGIPGGGTSNAVPFTVAPPGLNAVATLNSLSQTWVFSHGPGSKDLQLTLTGQHFILGAVGQVNGSNRPTKFVDSMHLVITLYGSDLATPTSVAITVFIPAPGGGVSNSLPLSIRKLYRRLLPIVRR